MVENNNQYTKLLQYPTDQDIRSVAKDYSNLVSLTIISSRQRDFGPLESLRTLKKLSLHGGSFDLDRLPILSNLEELNLTECKVENLDTYLHRLSELPNCRLEHLKIRDFEPRLEYQILSVRFLTIYGDGHCSTLPIAARFPGAVILTLLNMTIQSFESLSCLLSLEGLRLTKCRLLKFQGIEFCHNLTDLMFDESRCDTADEFLDPPRVLNDVELQTQPGLGLDERVYRMLRRVSEKESSMDEFLYWHPIPQELQGNTFPPRLLGIINCDVFERGWPNRGLQYCLERNPIPRM